MPVREASTRRQGTARTCTSVLLPRPIGNAQSESINRPEADSPSSARKGARSRQAALAGGAQRPFFFEPPAVVATMYVSADAGRSLALLGINSGDSSRSFGTTLGRRAEALLPAKVMYGSVVQTATFCRLWPAICRVARWNNEGSHWGRWASALLPATGRNGGVVQVAAL